MTDGDGIFRLAVLLVHIISPSIKEQSKGVVGFVLSLSISSARVQNKGLVGRHLNGQWWDNRWNAIHFETLGFSLLLELKQTVSDTKANPKTVGSLNKKQLMKKKETESSPPSFV